MNDVLLQRIISLERRLHASQVRERYWRERALEMRDGYCSGCREPWDTQTPGCRTCTYRHSTRRRKVAA